MKYEELGRDLGRLVDSKQLAYGDSFSKSGDVLRILYPDGVRPEQLDDMLVIARVVDKIFRIATQKDAFGESPWRDIAGYGLLAAARDAAPNTEQALAQPPKVDPRDCAPGFEIAGYTDWLRTYWGDK